MGAINRVPLGLLGLLDAKVLGRNPSEFAETAIPTIDVLNFYAFSRGYQIFNATTAASGTIGTKAQVNVPLGKLWLVYSISAEVVCAVAGALRFTAQIVDVQAAPTATTIALQSPANLNLAIGEEAVQVPNLSAPIILGRSQGVGVRFVEVDGVGTWAPTIRVMAVELDA